MTARVKTLWEANVRQKEMLSMLNEEGFAIKERELMKLRGQNRWLLHTANGDGLSVLAIELHQGPGERLKGKKSKQPIPAEQNDVSQHGDHRAGKQSEHLQKRPADDQERWPARKRRRHTQADAETPPRFPSETTLDESKVVLGLDNNLYRKIRDQFQRICDEENVIKKTVAGPDKWQQVKDRLIRENAHLQQVLQTDSSDPTEQKLLSLDLVCMDVTKRMRIMQNRVTIADAKHVLRLNPEESRQIRATFFAKLKEETFVNKTDLGQERWNQLKAAWISETPMLQRVLRPELPNYQERVKAVELLCRDVMKRLRDDQARREPQRQKQSKGSGPGPAPPRLAATKVPRAAARSSTTSTRSRTTGLPTSELFSGDLQIDPSLLLAASDALPHTLQPDDAEETIRPPSAAASYQSASIGVWLRLHPHSPLQADPKLWLGTLSAGTIAELRQQAGSEHPDARVTRIAGIVRDSGTGAEVSYNIDDDEKLGGYLAHVQGGDALFEVTVT